MSNSNQALLYQIATANAANEAEVETKIVLHLLRLLSYSDADRADKVAVHMRYGRELKEKIADFILYDGPERSLVNALVTIETKRVGESLDGAEEQARSYAAWAGTPFLIACNGEYVLAAQFFPGSGHTQSVTVKVSELPAKFELLRAFVGRTEAVLAKERINYISAYLPEVENLPASQFFQEYLSRLTQRFQNYTLTTGPLQPPASGELVVLGIPVTTRRVGVPDESDAGVDEFQRMLIREDTRILVHGAPGSGKSTLCRRLAGALASHALRGAGDSPIPIYLEAKSGIPASVPAAFRQACEGLGVRVFPELHRRALSNSGVVLLIDGLDECSRNINVVSDIRPLLIDDASFASLLTARTSWAESQADWDDQQFAKYRVRDLNDAEMHIVLRGYLKDPTQAERLMLRARAGPIPDIRSPLIALMAIRVANDVCDWEAMSIFDLYCAYVGVLNRFFNAPNVRGHGAPAVSDEAIIAAMSEAASQLRISRADGYGMTLAQLDQHLRQRDGDAVVNAFMNCGLMTSEFGVATFVHRTFEEFGVAWRIVTDFRTMGATGLSHRHISDSEYRIAASSLQLSDEGVLLVALTDSDSRIRRHAIGLLSRRPVWSAAIVEEVTRRIRDERSPKVWARMARMLIQARVPEFQVWVCAELSSLSATKLSFLSWAIRGSDDLSFFSSVLRLLIGAPTSRRLGLAAFDVALQIDTSLFRELLVNLFSQCSSSTRFSICRMLRRPTALSRLLVPELLRRETAPVVTVELLAQSSISQLIGDIQAVTQATKSIASELEFSGRQRRQLRELARRIRRSAADVMELLALAQACESVGKKRNSQENDP